MTNFIVNGLEQAGQTADTGEIGIVGANGLIATLAGSGVGLYPNSTLMVQGDILGSNNGVSIIVGGAWIIISSTGSILARNYGIQKIEFQTRSRRSTRLCFMTAGTASRPQRQ